MMSLRTKLDRSIVASVVAMLALNIVVLTQQLQAAPVPQVAVGHVMSLA